MRMTLNDSARPPKEYNALPVVDVRLGDHHDLAHETSLCMTGGFAAIVLNAHGSEEK